MNILITDLNIKLDGHKYGFVNNLIKYLEGYKTQNSYFILTNFTKEFKLVSTAENIKIHSLTADEQEIINSSKSFLLKAAAEWKAINSFTESHSINEVILMELDPYQVEIGRKKTNFSIAGIWFRPYSRMLPEYNTLKSKLLNARTKLQKKLTMDFALLNKNLKRVLILNDEQMPTLLNNPQKPRFFTLPDPYFEYPQIPGFDLRAKYNIPSENIILLQFGNMDERKNNENIIAALNSFEPEIAAKISLLVIGRFKEGYAEKLETLKKSDAKYQMILKDEFVSDEEMESTFAQSDLILRMNINFFGSSGIVGIAANHDKPCVVSNNGVMAELVAKYKLGDVIDPYDISEIKNTIERYLQNKETIKIDGQNYRKTHNLDAYARTLLQI
ncbi:glycosyltransferase family 1 protein [Lacihabitans sp. LS3-19]|uniref:glycosyltransferase n=1 Tax=Lacihabitans sp. LS3-19 TaxID=2487335 RepID=UPI0020CD61D9|nr:glycosyltransferase [Lacihabitans sp. LS3-19]MCP9770972.1 glycosyltransferase family 1 protein [Lacihabitans sp. LS3-19]